MMIEMSKFFKVMGDIALGKYQGKTYKAFKDRDQTAFF
jgi:hypothetical protein